MSGTNADERIGGRLQPSLETSETAYFGEDELPELSLDRNTESQIRSMFEYMRNPGKEIVLD
ncbi:NUDIX hydrolase [Paenibacillus oceani]|uniref:Uncharacterized protein n=1 Tax=Paenibacillus oceani TaxID=2772510 RepID=A0A927H0P1_9BACL|nr:hypothetical protein [Paenibacillus oceani]MBD2864286.1 hypothetical protein [Paenibacillus oceani]